MHIQIHTYRVHRHAYNHILYKRTCTGIKLLNGII